jgi:sulfur-carrier protein adenylyltransferase/sulfurtransferase
MHGRRVLMAFVVFPPVQQSIAFTEQFLRSVAILNRIVEGLSRTEVERYSRQLVLPEVGPDGQRKLKSSKAVVVGMGGLGLPASAYLVAAGVGTVGIIDHDTVEKSNLHRQTLYTEEDVGKPKAMVAADRLHQVNPHVDIHPFVEKLDSSNAMELLGRFDVVLDCTDNFPARYLISDACVLLRKPDIYASVFRFDGQASVFDADKGPCYRCLYPDPPPPDSVQDCATAGVLGVLPGILGLIQSVQAINIILGGKSLVGRLLLMDASDMTFTELRIRKSPSCPICGKDKRITRLIDYENFCGVKQLPAKGDEISPIELKQWIDSGRDFALLDVREPFEHSLCRIEDSTLIPLGALPARFEELDPKVETVVYCHSGIRSATAAEFLSNRGFRNVKNLKGGISAWAEQVDPRMPRY